MSKFNKYAWDLYKQSPAWEETASLFKPENLSMNELSLISKINPMDFRVLVQRHFYDVMNVLYSFNILQQKEPSNMEEAKVAYENILFSGVIEDEYEYVPQEDYKTMLKIVVQISFLCYYCSPDFFFPYLFRYKAFDLYKIVDTFDIILPKLPKKSDYKARCMYYWELCEVFYHFREEHGLSSLELCAFLYDFAPKYCDINRKKTGSMPLPSQAWFIGGFISEIDKRAGTELWQANPETKKGDILVHYETAPVSAITHIWISQTDGIVDPFFYYYANIYLGSGIEVPAITIKELREDEYFSSHPLVRKSFQGVNGTSMSSEDYQNLQRILQSKGFDISTLPKLYTPDLPKNTNIKNERGVETDLLEPTLNSIGLFEGRDFIRQVPIQSGRGTSIFPDYVIGYDGAKGKCSVMIEAKYHMKSSREIADAFSQARSYALILQASTMVLCDKECMIIYQNKGGFDRNTGVRYYWGDMKNPDKFVEIKSLLKA